MAIEKLYTIGGAYPDQDFNFALDGGEIGLVSRNHEHPMHKTSLNVSFPDYNLGDIGALKTNKIHSHNEYLHSINGVVDNISLIGTSNEFGTFNISANAPIINIEYISNAQSVSASGYINQNNSGSIATSRGLEVQLDNSGIIENDNEALVFDDEV